ncbi:conserved protein of unknown function [Pararobbsia alpina]|uniref:hypothetical protein n=1 Tax=Pararobbsia alpina TaxID=621374 RepID=UPI0039A55D7C
MKFEFGDLYKFVVSAGFVLVGAAVIAFWLLLKEPFDLTLKDTDIRALTPVAQQTVRRRQEIVADLVAWSPWVAPAFVVAGLGLVGYGLRRWRNLQSMSDELADLNLQEKRASIRPKTEDEIAGIDGMDSSDAGDEAETPMGGFASTSHKFEQELTSRLLASLDGEYIAQPRMMVADVGVDLVLRAKALLRKDILVEVKYIRKGFNEGWLTQVGLKMRSAALFYQSAENRIPNTCLVVGVADDAWSKRNYSEIAKRVSVAAPHRSAKHIILVAPESQLLRMPLSVLRSELGIAPKTA